MRLQDCSQQEVIILTAALSLLSQLPGDPAKYTRAMGEMRKEFFGSRGRGRGRKPAGFVQARETRAHERFGKL